MTRPQLEPVAGDTGLFPVMRQLAERVDVALLAVGGWGPPLGRGHLDPRRAAEVVARILPGDRHAHPLGLLGWRGGSSCRAYGGDDAVTETQPSTESSAPTGPDGP